MSRGGTTYMNLPVELPEDAAAEDIALMETGDLRVTNVLSYEVEHGVGFNIEIELAGQVTEMPSRGDKHEVFYTAPEGSDARAIEDKIRTEISEESMFERDFRRLVLGKPQVKTLNEHLEEEDDRPDCIKDWFSVDEIIRVPDPIIRVPV